jgi:hypothetical protein
VATRPEPTIYGNCDSWSFIVGKKPRAYTHEPVRSGSLRTNNKRFNHRLSTKFGHKHWDNLWAICGSAALPAGGFRMVVPSRSDMRAIAAGGLGFYRKRQVARF